MRRLVLAVLLLPLGCHLAVAQDDRTEVAKPTDKKDYRYNRIRIEDPAGFKTLQERVLFSGPQPGEKLPAFEAVGVFKRDPWLGKEFDPVALAKGKNQIIIFQHESGSLGILETIGFWRRFLPVIAKHSKQELHGTVVFLGPSLTDFSNLARNRDLTTYFKTSPFLYGYSTDGREGPGIYGLNRKVKQTIVLAKNGVVTHNFPFAHPHFTPDPHVLGGMAELIGVARGPLAESLNAAESEYQKMRRAKRKAKSRKDNDKKASRRNDASPSRF